MTPRLVTRSGGAVGVRATAAPDGSAMPMLVGRFASFDSWTEINSAVEGRFLEQIAPGAFANTIRENRNEIRVLFQHGQDPQIGEKPLASLETLGEDGIGAYYGGRLFDTAYGRDLVPLLAAGVLGSSFRFHVRRETLDPLPARSAHNRERLPERIVREVRLYELGPVTFPAYATTSAGLGTTNAAPRSRRMGDAEWLARLLRQRPIDTPAMAVVRRRWLDSVLPLPAAVASMLPVGNIRTT